MAVTTEHRAPKIRCYKCGSSTVQALCHHCWKPGCGQHLVRSPAWAERLFGVEGSGPGLNNVRAWHCGDCTHMTTGIWLGIGVSGIAAVCVGFLLEVLVSPVVTLSLVAIGVVMVIMAYARIRRHSARVRDGLPVALHPKVSGVHLLERARIRITLDAAGDYQTRADPVEGELVAILTFGGSDHERVRTYMRKHRLAADQKVPYSVGCLVPQGRVGIKELARNRVIKVRDDPAVALELGREDSPAYLRRRSVLKYTLAIDPDIKAGPFWVTPSIAPESEKHALEIDIQWTEFGSHDGDPLTLDLIDLLRIRVPVSWGRVQEIDRRSAMVDAPNALNGGEWSRAIEWKQLSPTQAERQARQLTIAVRFENPIRREDDLSGRLEATMKGSLSGIDGIRMYSALGAPRTISGAPIVRTRVEAEFTLSLAHVQYQAIRVFPDREVEDIDSEGFLGEFDVIPDDETVISLTNTLADNQFYVKRVTENPPRNSGRADVMHRYWNITGRSYEGVHPVDFHLMVTGEEVHRGDIRPESGNTKVRITVRGAYTDEEMCSRVDNTWMRLREVAREALQKPQMPPGGGSTMD